MNTSLTNANQIQDGLIFNIQRFSIHDGPGIRTTVFLKGCPLRCNWCSNPESQQAFPTLLVRDIPCVRCGKCAQTCPKEAISIDCTGRHIDWSICDNCLQCVDACLYQSLKMCGERISVEDALIEVLKDLPFYKNSNGGMTVSGGEPLMQAEFVASLLELCKQEGLHTCLDTTAYAPWEVMKEVLRFVDLVLFDVKHLDSREHQRTTGVPNDLILANLEKAANLTKIWLRIPLIAAFNDSEEHIKNVVNLGIKHGVEKISLLPYHEGGKNKCEQMGRPYPHGADSFPTDEHVEHLKEMIEAEGMSVSVGS